MRRCRLSRCDLQRRAVAAKQAVEDAARVVLRRNRPPFQAVGDRSRAGEEPGAGIDRQHQRRLPAVLLGVQRHDLIESDRVERAGLRIVQRGAGEPHVGADVRVGLWAARMVQSAHEAELLPEGTERLRRLAKDELAVTLGRGKPAPLVDAVFRFRQRHAVGGVERAEAAGNLLGHFGAHGVENRQGQRNSAHPFQKSTAVDLYEVVIGVSRLDDVSSSGRRGVTTSVGMFRSLLLEEQFAVDDEPDHVLHSVAVGLQL